MAFTKEDIDLMNRWKRLGEELNLDPDEMLLFVHHFQAAMNIIKKADKKK